MLEGISINKEYKKSNQEKAEKLGDFCKEHGNSLVFPDDDYGENFELRKMNQNKLVSRKNFLLVLKNYLSGPIFTDTFSKDHSKRRDWKKDNKDSMIKSQGESIFEYYSSNRLRLNNNIGLVSLINGIFKKLKDSEIKNKLQIIKNKIPPEITGDSERRYHELEDVEKIEVIKKFSEVIRELIIFLENKG